MKTIVVLPGGFHPYHAGHYALYKSAKEAFPGADVYVAATNSQEQRPFPFAIKEKLAKVAGVEPGHFIQVKSPFQAKEITQHYDPNQDVLIFVRSEKDRNESPKPGGMKKDGSPAYFQPYTGKNLQPFSKHAYFAYLPTVEFGPGITSATEIRNAWPTLNNSRKTAMVMSLYPATQKNPKLAANVVKLLDAGMGGAEGLTEDSSSSLPDVLYHGGEHLISKFKIPPFGVFFSPHKEWAEEYGDAITRAKVNASPVYLVDYDEDIDEDIIDALFDRDYRKLAKYVRLLQSKGYKALQTVTDSEMVCVFPGGDIQVLPPEQDVDEGAEEALQFATQAHAGQTRAGGDPYITHPMSVADSIKQYKKSHNLDAIISAALLHDTIEDTDTTHEALQDLFGGLVASLVQELTSDKEKIKQMGKADYLAQKMAAMSSYALVIKLADRLDNVKDIATAKTPEWRERYKAETEKILNYIEKHRALSGTHRKFIELIRNKLGEINGQQGVAEAKETDPVTSAVLNFYKPVVYDIHKEKVDNYVELARSMVQKTNDPNIRKKLIDIFKTGKENPYIQGGIVTTVGALLAGGVLSTSQRLGLSPAQTNLVLQAILNTVIPTVVSRINGKNWADTIKYTLASAGVGTGIAGASLIEGDLEENMVIGCCPNDVVNENLGLQQSGTYAETHKMKKPFGHRTIAMTDVSKNNDYLEEK